MDPVTIFFVLKALTGIGPEGTIALEGEESFLDAVDMVEFRQSTDAETNELQREINATLQTLTRMHTTRILLKAAVSEPNNPDRAPTEPAEFTVPAYKNDEVSEDHESVWPKGAKAIEKVEAANDTTLGMGFPTEIVQKRAINNTDRPMLQPFLEKFQEHELSPEFDPATCLKTCYDSASQLGVHSKSTHCIVRALDLLRLVWGPNVRHDLAEVSGWLNEAPDSLTDTENWLKQKLELGSLLVPLTTLYNSNQDEAKLAISKITAMLQTNGGTFSRIYERFVDTTNGLEKILTTFTANATGAQQKEWDNLLAATYGVIAWRIFQQARLAVDEARSVLGED